LREPTRPRPQWQHSTDKTSGECLKTCGKLLPVYPIDPLRDPRWSAFLGEHSAASIFHTPEWLDALRRTYGYEPVVFTTSAPGKTLTNGVAFCRINSWLTGRRLVSLPFSDHCDPLASGSKELEDVLCSLKRDSECEHWRYIEVRPRDPLESGLESHSGFARARVYYFHRLDLRQDLNELFRRFHKNSVQRKIRRAEREALTYEEGRSHSLLAKFYQMLLMTRRRHQLPVQPFLWFTTLVDCLGDRLKIRLASKDGKPVAGILTLSYKNSIVYKYGCSDDRFHNLGGMFLLFWKTIEEAKELGAHELDLGRSDIDNPGLVTFKDRLGTARSTLVYYQYPGSPSESFTERWELQFAKRVFTRLPDGVLKAVGKLLYRHIG
jgi:hypothetical protein